MNKFFKYFGLALIGCAFALEYTNMSADRIIIQAPIAIVGFIRFIVYLQKDIVESLTQNLKVNQ